MRRQLLLCRRRPLATRPSPTNQLVVVICHFTNIFFNALELFQQKIPRYKQLARVDLFLKETSSGQPKAETEVISRHQRADCQRRYIMSQQIKSSGSQNSDGEQRFVKPYRAAVTSNLNTFVKITIFIRNLCGEILQVLE